MLLCSIRSPVAKGGHVVRFKHCDANCKQLNFCVQNLTIANRNQVKTSKSESIFKNKQNCSWIFEIETGFIRAVLGLGGSGCSAATACGRDSTDSPLLTDALSLDCLT